MVSVLKKSKVEKPTLMHSAGSRGGSRFYDKMMLVAESDRTTKSSAKEVVSGDRVEEDCARKVQHNSKNVDKGIESVAPISQVRRTGRVNS